MNQFGITKIFNGLLVADVQVGTDVRFLLGNKISHTFAWVFHSSKFDLQQAQIQQFFLHKQDHIHPRALANSILQGCQFLQQAEQSCTCALIYTQNKSESMFLAVIYIINKFCWCLSSAVQFCSRKLQMEGLCEIYNTLIQQVIKLLFEQNKKLKTIEFSYQFLSRYQTQEQEEKLLLNTIMNSLVSSNIDMQIKNKRCKRVKWLDQIKNGTGLVSTTKIYGRGSSTSTKKNHKISLDRNNSNKCIFNKQISTLLLENKNVFRRNSGQFMLRNLSNYSKDNNNNNNNNNKCFNKTKIINHINTLKEFSEINNEQNRIKLKKKSVLRGNRQQSKLRNNDLNKNSITIQNRKSSKQLADSLSIENNLDIFR